MSMAMKNVKRFPALVIGLGGTGVRTLRYLRWQAESGVDSGLRRMYEDGHLQLLAIDTDWKANREEELDEHVVPRSAAFRSGGGHAFGRTLPTIEPIIGVRTDDIVRSVEAIRQAPRQRLRVVGGGEYDGSAESAVPAVAEWLPAINHEALNEMSLGQARYEGAGQWRPLGRIGLFTEARAIYDKLKDSHERVRKVTEPGKPVRVHLVCSLSGGTGAGTFWDVAFMMRHIDPDCALTGAFLLADPFVASDRAERVETNAYAALKELAAYKNWRLRPDETFKVRYPIGRQGLTFEARRGDTSVFNLVYLYQSFKPEGEPAEIPDLAASTIRMTCFRIAENILSQLRQDVRAKLDEGANNEKTDVNAPIHHRERGFVFSTSAVTPLALAEIGEMARTLEAAILNRVIDDTGAHRPVTPGRKVKMSLLQAIPSLATGASSPGLPDTAATRLYGEERELKRLEQGTLIDLWQRSASEDGPPEACARINGMRAALDVLKARIKELKAGRKDPLGPEARAQELYQLVDEALREPWAAVIESQGWSVETGGVEAVKADLRHVDLCEAELDERWKPFREALNALCDSLDRSIGILDDEGLELLRTALLTLEGMTPVPPEELRVSSVVAPPSLIQMRIALNILNETRDEDLIHQHAMHGSGPLDVIMAKFRERLDAILADVGRAVLDPKTWPKLVDQFLHQNRERLAGDIRKILEMHDRNLRLLNERNVGLQTYGQQKLRGSFTQHNQHAERFERMMAPLPATLRSILASDTPNRLDTLLDELNGLFARDAIAEGEDLRNHFQDGPSRRAVWKEFLKDIVAAAEPRDVRSQPALPLVQTLAEAIDRHFLRPHNASGNREDIRTNAAFDHFQTLARLYADGFVRFWSEQEAFIIARLNGDQGLEELIARCRSTVFGKGPVAPTIQQAKLVIGKPQIGRALSEDRSASDRNALMNRLKAAAQKVLNITPTFTEEASPVPIIYYEELYRAGAEISGIQRYHRRYRDADPRFRSLFHFQRGADELENLVPDELAPDAVLCGNKGCSYDLGRLPGRDQLICPGCGGPILNRCGNPSCPADDLTERLPPSAFDGLGRPTVRQCPCCHGELKTYWWHCPESAHDGRLISMRDTTCPQCLEGYVAGHRPLAAVRRRDPDDSIDCPGCMALRLAPGMRTRIPAALRTYFENGVAALDRFEFEQLIDNHHFLEHRCPNQNVPEHLLFPALEVKDGAGKKLVHVHRADGRFSAEAGVPTTAHSCFHCGFPASAADVEATRIGKPLTCRRCQRTLQVCQYCSSHDGALFEPMPSTIGAIRCPRCTNLMLRDTSDYQSIAADGLKRPGFCRNLFSCHAGARPWSTAADYDLGNCQACGGADKIPLLPFEHLSRHIDVCPICLVLLGRRETNRVRHFRPEDVAEYFRDRPAHTLPDSCVICGSQPARVLRWMLETGYFGATNADVQESTLQALRNTFSIGQPIPDIPAELGMDILEAMLQDHTERALHESITALPGIREGHFDLSVVHAQLSILFAGPQISARAVRGKLETMVHISEEVRRRERTFVGDEMVLF
ncbi:tubulin-like doman-containing protein [Azospirillum sp. sgz302134]